jgi:hypothetical protein
MATPFQLVPALFFIIPQKIVSFFNDKKIKEEP